MLVGYDEARIKAAAAAAVTPLLLAPPLQRQQRQGSPQQLVINFRSPRDGVRKGGQEEASFRTPRPDRTCWNVLWASDRAEGQQPHCEKEEAQVGLVGLLSRWLPWADS